MNVILKHVVLDHIVVKSERCQSVLGKAMDYRGDKNYLNGSTQNVFSRETCLSEVDCSDILGNEWCNLETVKQAELNTDERCADCDKNPVVEGNTGDRNILLSWRKEKIWEYLQTRERVFR